MMRVMTSLLLAGALGLPVLTGCAGSKPESAVVAPLSGPQQLWLVPDAVRSSIAAGELPVVIFDLDGTLFHNGPRTKEIWLAFARQNRTRYPGLLPKIEAIDPFALPYTVQGALAEAGITDDVMVRELMDAWFAGFFSNEYPKYDVPLAGSVEFVNGLHAEGALVVYLTGRDAPRMLLGTSQSLQQSGFPIGRARVELIMKPDRALDDEEFKPMTYDYLDGLGRVVACFENEPANINSLHRRFPEAVSLFVDTNHRPGAPAVAAELASIQDFTASP